MRKFLPDSSQNTTFAAKEVKIGHQIQKEINILVPFYLLQNRPLYTFITVWSSWFYSIPTQVTKLRLDKIIVWYHVRWMKAFITVLGNREHNQDGDSVKKVYTASGPFKASSVSNNSFSQPRSFQQYPKKNQPPYPLHKHILSPIPKPTGPTEPENYTITVTLDCVKHLRQDLKVFQILLILQNPISAPFHGSAYQTVCTNNGALQSMFF